MLTRQVRNDGKEPQKATLVVSIGESFENAVAAAMYQVRNMVQNKKSMSDELQKEFKALEDGFDAAQLENWYDGLGFCTSVLSNASYKYSRFQARGTGWVSG